MSNKLVYSAHRRDVANRFFASVERTKPIALGDAFFGKMKHKKNLYAIITVRTINDRMDIKIEKAYLPYLDKQFWEKLI